MARRARLSSPKECGDASDDTEYKRLLPSSPSELPSAPTTRGKPRNGRFFSFATTRLPFAVLLGFALYITMTTKLLCYGSALVAGSHLVAGAPQFSPTVQTQGLVPTSLLPTAASTATPVIPPGQAASVYDESGLAALWSQVEKSIPVEYAKQTSVVSPKKNFTVPKTPTLPASLQDHAGSLKAPKGFLFGVASADQQWEGGVKADGRGPSHWDWLCHRAPSYCTNYTADVTDNGRYLYKEDIARIKAMGVNAFSFAISWSRVVPFAKAGSPVSEEGLAFYEDLVKELLANDITPIATLFHWSTPLNLVFEYGGFLNETIVEDYEYYADIVFKRLGKYVKTFFTFNEPRVYCSEYQGPPFDAYYDRYGLNSSTAQFPCSYHLLQAHGKAVARYRSLVNSGEILKGEIAFKNDDSVQLPKNPDNPEDVRASERHTAFFIGIFSQPVYGDGNWPDAVRSTVPKKFLPDLTDQDKASIKGSADFFAIDGYRTNIASAPPNGIDACIKNITDPNWPACQDNSNIGQYATSQGYALGPPADPNANWLYNTAPYLSYQFKQLKKLFPYNKIYLSEFGFAEPFSYLRQDQYQILYDTDRTAYYQDYLGECLKAINDDGIPLAGVFAWSFIDNFEWGSGLEQRFGMQYVNYTDPNLERHYKLSFLAYRDFIKNHSS